MYLPKDGLEKALSIRNAIRPHFARMQKKPTRNLNLDLASSELTRTLVQRIKQDKGTESADRAIERAITTESILERDLIFSAARTAVAITTRFVICCRLAASTLKEQSGGEHTLPSCSLTTTVHTLGITTVGSTMRGMRLENVLALVAVFMASAVLLQHALVSFAESSSSSSVLTIPTSSLHVSSSRIPAFQCLPDQTEKQATLFKKRLRKDSIWSACPANELWESVHLQMRKAGQTSFVLVDVGANKGYTSGDWLRIWKPALGISPKTIYDFYSQEFSPKLCGMCKECKMSYSFSNEDWALESVDLTIHMVEPSPSTHEMLVKMKDRLDFKGFQIHRFAAYNESTELEFVAAHAGWEVGAIAQGNTATDYLKSGSVVKVKAMKLDDWFQSSQIHHVDILKIDAEGFDPLVLQGTQEFLRGQRASILAFEYHSINFWNKDNPFSSSLKEWVDRLDSFDYDCYIEGRDNILVRLTGCWDDRFEFRKWSNVACVLRSQTSINNAMMSLTTFLSQEEVL